MKLYILSSLFLILLVSGCAKYYVVEEEMVIQGNVETDDFNSYSVDVGEGLDPKEFSNQGVSLRFDGEKILRDEAIARIDAGFLNEGFNTIRITINDKNNNKFSEYAYIYVDNDKILYPENRMSFLLVEKKPANLPPDVPPIYYIIEKDAQEEGGVIITIGSTDQKGTDEKMTEEQGETGDEEARRIEGSKIDIRGDLNEEGLSRYEIDYTYDPDKRVWFNDGIELVKLSRESDLLGRLDLKKLKYNGILTIRLRTYRGNGVVSSEIIEVNVRSDIYQFLDFAQESKITNLEENKIDGFLSIGIEKFNVVSTPVGPREVWSTYKIIKDNIPFDILKKQTRDLSRIDLEEIRINETGEYRVYIEFIKDDLRNIEYSPFEVVHGIERTDSCKDGTVRSSCSTESISYYCGFNLQLIQNCNYCGCQEGFTCSSSGQCTTRAPPRDDRIPRKGRDRFI